MAVEHVDVLIVGAGLSGIGAACHLREQLPGKSLAILEARGATGGTWDLFRYPGIRSDSDMYTLGYSFKPWAGKKAIADGDSILKYIRETAAEHGVDRLVRLNHRVLGADFSRATGLWTVDVERPATGGGTEIVQFTTNFVYGCAGYYRYDTGYTPEFAGLERFTGQVVHPQFWPEDLDYAGKKVVVIGSGATAVTLVPSMAPTAGHVTMLQRTPTWILPLPGVDPLAQRLHGKLPAGLAAKAVRWKNIFASAYLYNLSKKNPAKVKGILRHYQEKFLPEGYDIDKHFTAPYDPWDQRLCIVPNADLFRAITKGTASVVTDTIETFTETGIQLTSGEHLEADIVVTATGLALLTSGGVHSSVDGVPIVPRDHYLYKGMMLDGVPNFVLTVGYTNASWTLKADLISQYVCRLLKHLDDKGYSYAEPIAPGKMDEYPLIDLDSGYVRRAAEELPRQGAKPPWRLYQNYLADIRLLRRGKIDDGVLHFATATAPAPTRTPAPTR